MEVTIECIAVIYITHQLIIESESTIEPLPDSFYTLHEHTNQLVDQLSLEIWLLLPADEFAPTVELKINFIRAAKVGPLFGEGRVVHKGKSIAFLEGELRNSEGQLIATATATVQIQKIRS